MTKKDDQKNNLKKSFLAPQSPDEKEKDLEALMGKVAGGKASKAEEDDQPGKEKHRVTLDLSKQLARKVKAEAAQRDLTMKGFIVELLNRYFDEKDRK